MRGSDPEQLAAVAGHDLRGHLLGIAGYAQLLAVSAASVREDPEAMVMVEQICLGAEGGLALIDDLLAYASCLWRPSREERVDLDGLVAGLLGEHDPSHIEVGVLGAVHADPALVRHLFRHMLRNAVSYARPGVPARVKVTAEPLEGVVRICVADNGLGIAVGEREVVFEPFERGSATRAIPGTGLGLAICRQVVARYGGHIGAEDSPYGGTSMIFVLPRAEAS